MTQLEELIRNIPDFPEKGVMFKDITPLLRDAQAFHAAVEQMAAPFKQTRIDAVVAIESRGFILGAPMAALLGVGFVPVRKAGKLPFHTYRAEYSLEYGNAAVEIHRDGVLQGEQVLIVDDVLATGGTMAASAQLVEQSGATVAGMSVLIELDFLNGREQLKGYDLQSVIHY